MWICDNRGGQTTSAGDYSYRNPIPGIDDTALSAAGFRSVALEPWDVPPDLTDMFLYAGKNRPEIYFDEGFRNGISSFREYAAAEVPHGLARLRADLDSGRWEAIRAGADHGRGDYCFFVAE